MINYTSQKEAIFTVDTLHTPADSTFKTGKTGLFIA
jgi:hypothetical protein